MSFDEDIYSDLKDVDLGEEILKLQATNNQLLEQIASLEGDVDKLCKELVKMKEVQNTLAKNISELFKTAKAEIERKDRTIADLRRQLDDILLKRLCKDSVGYNRFFRDTDSSERSRQGSIELEKIKKEGNDLEGVAVASRDRKRGRNLTPERGGKRNESGCERDRKNNERDLKRSRRESPERDYKRSRSDFVDSELKRKRFEESMKREEAEKRRRNDGNDHRKDRKWTHSPSRERDAKHRGSSKDKHDKREQHSKDKRHEKVHVKQERGSKSRSVGEVVEKMIQLKGEKSDGNDKTSSDNMKSAGKDNQDINTKSETNESHHDNVDNALNENAELNESKEEGEIEENEDENKQRCERNTAKANKTDTNDGTVRNVTVDKSSEALKKCEIIIEIKNTNANRGTKAERAEEESHPKKDDLKVKNSIKSKQNQKNISIDAASTKSKPNSTLCNVESVDKVNNKDIPAQAADDKHNAIQDAGKNREKCKSNGGANEKKECSQDDKKEQSKKNPVAAINEQDKVVQGNKTVSAARTAKTPKNKSSHSRSAKKSPDKKKDKKVKEKLSEKKSSILQAALEKSDLHVDVSKGISNDEAADKEDDCVIIEESDKIADNKPTMGVNEGDDKIENNEHLSDKKVQQLDPLLLTNQNLFNGTGNTHVDNQQEQCNFSATEGNSSCNNSFNVSLNSEDSNCNNSGVLSLSGSPRKNIRKRRCVMVIKD